MSESYLRIGAKLKQYNNSTEYKLVDAVDVDLGDGTSLQDFIDNLDIDYETGIPNASDTTVGGVKIDNDSIKINGNGQIYVDSYELPTASDTVKGGIKVGDGLAIGTDDKLSLDMPLATADKIGGIKIGENLQYNKTNPSVLDVVIPVGTINKIGGFKVGENLSVDENDKLNVVIPKATTSKIGGVIVGDGLSIDTNGVVKISIGDSLIINDGKLEVSNTAKPNYTDMINKPSINGKELNGDLSVEDLGLNGSLSEDLIVNLDVGGIKAGTTFARGTSFEEIFKKLLITYLPPLVTAAITNGGSYYFDHAAINGTTITVNITERSNPVTSVEFYKENELLNTVTEAPYTYTYTDSIDETTTFYAKVYDGTTTPVSKTAGHIEFVYPSYFKAIEVSEKLTEDDITADYITDNINRMPVSHTSKGYSSDTLNTTYSQIIYAYPKKYGALSKIMDDKNMTCTNSYSVKTLTINDINYYCYYLTDPAGFKGSQIYS